jgi:hypothetical protein
MEDMDKEPPGDGVKGTCYVQLEHHLWLLQPMGEPSPLMNQHEVVMDAELLDDNLVPSVFATSLEKMLIRLIDR